VLSTPAPADGSPAVARVASSPSQPSVPVHVATSAVLSTPAPADGSPAVARVASSPSQPSVPVHVATSAVLSTPAPADGSPAVARVASLEQVLQKRGLASATNMPKKRLGAKADQIAAEFDFISAFDPCLYTCFAVSFNRAKFRWVDERKDPKPFTFEFLKQFVEEEYKGARPITNDTIISSLAELFKLQINIYNKNFCPLRIISESAPDLFDRSIVNLLQDEDKYLVLWPKPSEVDLSSESEFEHVVTGAKPKDTFNSFHKATESLSKIKWLFDICRKPSPLGGSGLFVLRKLGKDICVARYSGHLVTDDGVVVFHCSETDALFASIPSLAARGFSVGHCAKIEGRRSNLMVDGSHHACSRFDTFPDRNHVPWASCINSSITQHDANCIIKW
jgi:hypothetical protein